VGVFGEVPSLALASSGTGGAPDGVRNADGTRMDVIWLPERLGVANAVVARLDTSRVGGEVLAYVGRIVGLVFLISAVVTVVTMMVLGRTVIYPFLDLRTCMLAAGCSPATPEDHIVPVARDDEIGDVMDAFNGMLRNLEAEILIIRAKETDLALANETLERQVEERTTELTGLNRDLRREITERGRAEQEIARLSRFPEATPHPVLRVSDDACVLYANGPSAGLLEYWGISVGGRLPQPWARIVGDVYHSGMRNEQEMTTGERVFILTLQPDSECVNIYGRDITARMEAEKRLRHISNHDMLTGLPNRALFLDQLDQALGHARRNEGRGAVLLIDLDNLRTSTTPSAMRRVTPCCRRRRSAWPGAWAEPIPWPGSVATNSPSSWLIWPMPPTWRSWPKRSSPTNHGPSPSMGGPYTAAPASASWFMPTGRREISCAAPTSPFTRRREKGGGPIVSSTPA
jgi:PAS domain-containing protein